MSPAMTRLGVDLGATWLRVCLVRGSRTAWSGRAPSVHWRRVPEVLRRMLRERGLGRVDRLVLGGAGLGRAEDRAELARLLKPLSARARVLTDYELAHWAFFGAAPGVLLVASTGSIAYARGPGGARRAGGLGPLLGDDGSGFWLGRRALRDEALRRELRLPEPLELARAEDPVRRIAALAPRVLRGRSARAIRLRAEAARLLAALALDAAAGLHLPKPLPLALHGSLFKNAALRAAVLRRLGRVRLAAARASAERAAAGLLL